VAVRLADLVPDPVLSPQLFRIRAFELLSLTGFPLGLTMFAANIYLPAAPQRFRVHAQLPGRPADHWLGSDSR